jgi:rubrerythrin
MELETTRFYEGAPSTRVNDASIRKLLGDLAAEIERKHQVQAEAPGKHHR